MSTSALAYNPAGMVLGKVYHIEGNADYLADLKTVALGGALVDSSTSSLAAGFALRGFLSGASGLGGIDGRLALAYPITDMISLGVSGRYLSVNGEANVDGMREHERFAKGFTMDTSLRVAPTQYLQFDLAGYNFIQLASAYVPTMVGGGGALALGDVAVLGLDVLADLTSFSKPDFEVGGGIEVFAANTLPLRAGYSYDTQRKQNTISFGLGYTDRSVGIDLSLRQQLGGLGDTELMLAFRVYAR